MSFPKQFRYSVLSLNHALLASSLASRWSSASILLCFSPADFRISSNACGQGRRQFDASAAQEQHRDERILRRTAANLPRPARRPLSGIRDSGHRLPAVASPPGVVTLADAGRQRIEQEHHGGGSGCSARGGPRRGCDSRRRRRVQAGAESRAAAGRSAARRGARGAAPATCDGGACGATLSARAGLAWLRGAFGDVFRPVAGRPH